MSEEGGCAMVGSMYISYVGEPEIRRASLVTYWGIMLNVIRSFCVLRWALVQVATVYIAYD